MDLNTLTLRTVLLQRLSDRLQKELATARRELTEALGTEGRRLAEVDNQRLATVSVTKKRAKVMVTDLFLDWAQEHYPTEVETETVIARKVSPTLVSGVKRSTELAGEPCGPRGELDVPGVSLADGYLSLRPTADSDEAISHLWRNGRLNHVVDLNRMLGTDE